jgi:hypothetical protein
VVQICALCWFFYYVQLLFETLFGYDEKYEVGISENALVLNLKKNKLKYSFFEFFFFALPLGLQSFIFQHV